MRKNDLIKISLPCEINEMGPRECCMSVSLFENARQTMGELRDIMRMTGLSWDFIQKQINMVNHPFSPIEKELKSIDDYSIGLGKSLEFLPHNVW